MQGEEGRRRKKPPRPDLCRRYARKELAAGLPAILECFMEEATKGSIPHAKALMSLAGLDRAEDLPALKPKRKKGLSVGEMLLKELRREPGDEAAAERES